MNTPLPTSSLPVDQLTPAEAGAPLVVPVIEETAYITREVVETGRVRLTKTVTERPETLPLSLRRDEVQVERVPVNQFLPDGAPAPGSRYEGEILVVPVLREVMVKRLLLVEELRVTNRRAVTEEPQTVLLRHEEVHVERLPPRPAAVAAAGPPPGSPA